LKYVSRSYSINISAFHHIQDTHVCHHLFPKLPHYHAEEATAHLIKKLGPYYLRIEDNVIQQTYECFVDCAFVDDKEKPGVYWWDFKK
jgi:omega-6 fatty acid desaturase (delta-12 desaturase)